eukprot:scaffold60723_cov38-Cyclotella_meneghiniana.AAC.2
MVGGEAQRVFSHNYESCSVFVGPAWTTQLSAIGEWAGVEQKPIVSGHAVTRVTDRDKKTKPTFKDDEESAALTTGGLSSCYDTLFRKECTFHAIFDCTNDEMGKSQGFI